MQDGKKKFGLWDSGKRITWIENGILDKPENWD